MLIRKRDFHASRSARQSPRPVEFVRGGGSQVSQWVRPSTCLRGPPKLPAGSNFNNAAPLRFPE